MLGRFIRKAWYITWALPLFSLFHLSRTLISDSSQVLAPGRMQLSALGLWRLRQQNTKNWKYAGVVGEKPLFYVPTLAFDIVHLHFTCERWNVKGPHSPALYIQNPKSSMKVEATKAAVCGCYFVMVRSAAPAKRSLLLRHIWINHRPTVDQLFHSPL